MSPTLYHVPKTISSPIVQILHEMNVVENGVQVVTLTFAQLKEPTHLARNPMGSSPALTDDENGIAIWESGAVLTYLLQIYDTEFQIHPNPSSASLKERAAFLHLQQYIIATVYPFLASLFIHTLKPKEEQDEEYVGNAISKWRTLLAPTLVNFLGSNDYFMGHETPSAIDFLMAKPFGNANSLGLLEEFPSLYSVYEKIRNRDSYAIAYAEQKHDRARAESRSMVLVPGK
jgi:glutathione S-transferase